MLLIDYSMKTMNEKKAAQERIVSCATLTKFQCRVLLALLEIPRGRVVSYADLATKVGCGSAQAVGQALKKNPFAPEVPCHRVLSKDGRIGGYVGERKGEKIEQKRRLLRAEGVEFDAEGCLLDRERFYPFITS